MLRAWCARKISIATRPSQPRRSTGIRHRCRSRRCRPPRREATVPVPLHGLSTFQTRGRIQGDDLVLVIEGHHQPTIDHNRLEQTIVGHQIQVQRIVPRLLAGRERRSQSRRNSPGSDCVDAADRSASNRHIGQSWASPIGAVINIHVVNIATEKRGVTHIGGGFRPNG